jgi:hypothetical protein
MLLPLRLERVRLTADVPAGDWGWSSVREFPLDGQDSLESS